jgi:hypothetical protein
MAQILYEAGIQAEVLTGVSGGAYTAGAYRTGQLDKVVDTYLNRLHRVALLQMGLRNIGSCALDFLRPGYEDGNTTRHFRNNLAMLNLPLLTEILLSKGGLRLEDITEDGPQVIIAHTVLNSLSIRPIILNKHAAAETDPQQQRKKRLGCLERGAAYPYWSGRIRREADNSLITDGGIATTAAQLALRHSGSNIENLIVVTNNPDDLRDGGWTTNNFRRRAVARLMRLSGQSRTETERIIEEYACERHDFIKQINTVDERGVASVTSTDAAGNKITANVQVLRPQRIAGLPDTFAARNPEVLALLAESGRRAARAALNPGTEQEPLTYSTALRSAARTVIDLARRPTGGRELAEPSETA